MSHDRAKPLDGRQLRSASRQAPRALFRGVRRWLAAVPVCMAALIAQTPLAHALDCLPVSQPLVKIPEIVTQNGVLRGTVELQDVQLRMVFRIPQLNGNAVPPGTPGAINQCLGQTVRGFRGLNAVPPVQPGPFADPNYPDPVPGPTLRARVGDIVELTFINQLDPARFGATRNDGQQDTVKGCDTVNVGAGGTAGYPYKSLNPAVPGDTFPDCFHGSSSGNLHFHGSHTNTNGTADNVFLEVRPSPRVNNKPTIGPDTYKAQFDAFFKTCEQRLRASPLAEWPSNWNEAPLGPWTSPGTWTAMQMKLLDASDQATNTKVAQAGQWPQYYIGAYPYCFQLPNYPYQSFPPPPGGIQMGQAPGTHWYHAHKHGSTAIDVANGMVGAFIIEGKYDDDLNAFYGTGWARTQPVMVLNQLGVQPNLKRSGGGGAGQNDKGPDFSVNGREQPIVDMLPGEVQLWRIVNGSGRSGAFIRRFPPEFNFRQIAQDGVQFANENYQASQDKPILLASGNRADLLVQAPLTPGIYPLMVQHEVDPSDLTSAIPVVLLQIRVREGVPPVTGNRSKFIPTAPPQPAFLTNITDAEVGSTLNNPRVIKFATGNGPPYAQHTINGQKFDDNQPPVAVTLDAVEQWKIMNYTFGPPISHPFHIHLNPFQIVEVFDPNAKVRTTNGNGTVAKYVVEKKDVVDDKVQCLLDLNDETTWKDCHNDTSNAPRVWWDVFPIPTGAVMSSSTVQNKQVPGYFMMRSRFVDFPGQYVIHCHILAHEDRGMMTIVELQRANAPAAMLMHHH
jgi:FtsP/CotA-like multicopper oxidase with cupredoxin domain